MNALRSRRAWKSVAGATAIAITCLVAGGAFTAASASSPASVVTRPDHQRVSVTLAPGSSAPITLPASNDPVRIDIDKVSTNGGIQTPSEVFSALVNVDAHAPGMSWIGTNSDGTQTGSSTIDGKNIANLVCGSGCVIASLNVLSVAGKTLTLKADAETSIIDETYVINIWY